MELYHRNLQEVVKANWLSRGEERDLRRKQIDGFQGASERVIEPECHLEFVGRIYGVEPHRSRYLDEFLGEWASEIHENKVNAALSRLGFPSLSSFSFFNPYDWDELCEEFFEINPSLEVYKYSLVIDLLVGEAKQWFSLWSLDGDEDDGWDEFVEALCTRFENEEQIDESVEELSLELKFDSLKSCVVEDFSECEDVGHYSLEEIDYDGVDVVGKQMAQIRELIEFSFRTKRFQEITDVERQFLLVFENAEHKKLANVVILLVNHLFQINNMDFVQKHVNTNVGVIVSCMLMDDNILLGLSKQDTLSQWHFWDPGKWQLSVGIGVLVHASPMSNIPPGNPFVVVGFLSLFVRHDNTNGSKLVGEMCAIIEKRNYESMKQVIMIKKFVRKFEKLKFIILLELKGHGVNVEAVLRTELLRFERKMMFVVRVYSRDNSLFKSKKGSSFVPLYVLCFPDEAIFKRMMTEIIPVPKVLEEVHGVRGKSWGVELLCLTSDLYVNAALPATAALALLQQTHLQIITASSFVAFFINLQVCPSFSFPFGEQQTLKDCGWQLLWPPLATASLHICGAVRDASIFSNMVGQQFLERCYRRCSYGLAEMMCVCYIGYWPLVMYCVLYIQILQLVSTMLHATTANNNDGIIKFVLDRKGTNARNMCEEHLLHMAAKNWCNGATQSLLFYDVFVESRVNNGMTPLHIFVWTSIEQRKSVSADSSPTITGLLVFFGVANFCNRSAILCRIANAEVGAAIGVVVEAVPIEIEDHLVA